MNVLGCLPNLWPKWRPSGSKRRRAHRLRSSRWTSRLSRASWPMARSAPLNPMRCAPLPRDADFQPPIIDRLLSIFFCQWANWKCVHTFLWKLWMIQHKISQQNQISPYHAQWSLRQWRATREGAGGSGRAQPRRQVVWTFQAALPGPAKPKISDANVNISSPFHSQDISHLLPE